MLGLCLGKALHLLSRSKKRHTDYIALDEEDIKNLLDGNSIMISKNIVIVLLDKGLERQFFVRGHDFYENYLKVSK